MSNVSIVSNYTLSTSVTTLSAVQNASLSNVTTEKYVFESVHGYLEELDMNEKYVVYQSGPIFSCDVADQLKNHCSTKPINLRFGPHVYHSSRHPPEKNTKFYLE